MSVVSPKTDTDTRASYFIVHPTLHGSGFGNQVGMMLQHIALAAHSQRTLVLPPFHVPPEHRHAGFLRMVVRD